MNTFGAQFRPCIDLHGGKVKQIVGSTLSDSEENLSTNFVASFSPAYYAKLYQKHNLTGGHVIQLGPGNTQAAKEALAAWPKGLQIGGGINDSNAQEWLACGAAQVIVTSFIFSDGKFCEENLMKLCKTVKKSELVLDLSCRKKDGKYFIVTDRWQKFTSLELNKDTLEFFAQYACEFLSHAVDVEGKCNGIDPTLVDTLGNYSPIPAVYAGGIRDISDIELIEKSGKGLVHYTIGSALDIFGGSLSFDEVVSRKQM